MIPLIDMAVISLASGRVAYAIARDEIFRPLREYVYRYSAPISDTDIDGQPHRLIHHWKNNKRERALGWGRWSHDYDTSIAPRKPGWLGRLVECPYCLSFYTTIGALIVYSLFGIEVLYVFALWAVANLYARLI